MHASSASLTCRYEIAVKMEHLVQVNIIFVGGIILTVITQQQYNSLILSSSLGILINVAYLSYQIVDAEDWMMSYAQNSAIQPRFQARPLPALCHSQYLLLFMQPKNGMGLGARLSVIPQVKLCIMIVIQTSRYSQEHNYSTEGLPYSPLFRKQFFKFTNKSTTALGNYYRQASVRKF